MKYLILVLMLTGCVTVNKQVTDNQQAQAQQQPQKEKTWQETFIEFFTPHD